ncbi:MAG: GxxExxY protein [Prevotella sp.]|nr:GxxExxY protein [Prevotella sp.]
MTEQEYLDMYDVVGVALDVYNELGRGMEEPIYQEALALEFQLRGMEVEREKLLTLSYKGIKLEKFYKADFYFKGIVIEIKSVDQITSDHRAQLFNYMRIAKKERGLLFNYGEKNMHTERYLYISEDDEFVLINKSNLKLYIDSKKE